MLTFIFSICAAVGGTILILQLILAMIGQGMDADIDVDPSDLSGGDVGSDGAGFDHDSDSFKIFQYLSLQAIVAFFTFFGLAGLAGTTSDFAPAVSLGMAIAGGVASVYGVHWMMKTMHKLRADGTVRIERSIGERGVVYLRIPAAKAGAGKIHVSLQNRTVELLAMSETALPTGAQVVVVDVLGPETVEVRPIEEIASAIKAASNLEG